MSDDLFELGERIADLAARINIATYEMLTLVADFDNREGWADHSSSCADWLAWRTGRSELDGVRVCAETSRRMACDAALVAMSHRDGEVVSVGRKTRTVPPHIRRALEERDRGCRYPGCGSRFTEAHHVKHWAGGGETSLANTVLLCRRHHRVVHEGRTRMALDRNRKAAFFTRSGKVIGSAPPLPVPAEKLPPPPEPPLGRLSNGAARRTASTVPLRLELEALEAVA